MRQVDGGEILVEIDHPHGSIEVPLSEWIRTGPGPRPYLRPTAARRVDGAKLGLGAIPLRYRNSWLSRRLIAWGLLEDPWPGEAKESHPGPLRSSGAIEVVRWAAVGFLLLWALLVDARHQQARDWLFLETRWGLYALGRPRTERIPPEQIRVTLGADAWRNPTIDAPWLRWQHGSMSGWHRMPRRPVASPQLQWGFAIGSWIALAICMAWAWTAAQTRRTGPPADPAGPT